MTVWNVFYPEIIDKNFSSSNEPSRSNSIRVYNCTSGELNPVIWQDYGQATLKYSRKNPTKYVMLYPNFSYRTNRVIHTFYEWFYHFLPAILFDVLLRLRGTKPFLFKIAKRYKAAADTGTVHGQENLRQSLGITDTNRSIFQVNFLPCINGNLKRQICEN